jgi:hypothetical protein
MDKVTRKPVYGQGWDSAAATVVALLLYFYFAQMDSVSLLKNVWRVILVTGAADAVVYLVKLAVWRRGRAV